MEGQQVVPYGSAFFWGGSRVGRIRVVGGVCRGKWRVWLVWFEAGAAGEPRTASFCGVSALSAVCSFVCFVVQSSIQLVNFATADCRGCSRKQKFPYFILL